MQQDLNFISSPEIFFKFWLGLQQNTKCCFRMMSVLLYDGLEKFWMHEQRLKNKQIHFFWKKM